jgi:uridine phosphorylase
MQPHIRCKKGDISEYVLLPGDPARVKTIANFLENAKEVANNREFLTYRGKYKGVDITVTSTGIGYPSAAIAVEELANLGAKVFIRIGTCGALRKGIKTGDLIIPFAAIRAEGTSKEYIPLEFPAVVDPEVFHALVDSAKKQKFKFFTGINRTHDAFYEHINNFIKWGDIYLDERMQNWRYPLVSSEMECAIVFLLPLLRGLRAGCVLTVNTPEPLDEVVKDPNMIYRLEESTSAKSGIENAIKTALEAIVTLEEKH